MIKHVNGCEVSRGLNKNQGPITDDFIDSVRLTGLKKPGSIIIHTITNDIQNKVNTLHKVRKVITTIKEIHVNNEVEIAFSGVIHHGDQDYEEKIKETKRKLKNLRKAKRIMLININNIDGSYLNINKLDLNKSGTVKLVKKISLIPNPT